MFLYLFIFLDFGVSVSVHRQTFCLTWSVFESDFYQPFLNSIKPFLNMGNILFYTFPLQSLELCPVVTPPWLSLTGLMLVCCVVVLVGTAA